MNSLNSGWGVMGRDFSPLLRGKPRPVEPPYGPVPSADSALVGMWSKGWVGVRTPEYTMECELSSLRPTKLFHNTEDPYQVTNLVKDPAYRGTAKRLYDEVLAWLEYAEPTNRSGPRRV